jgi:predicted DNA-binding transcriptional regulator AlpA
MATKQAASGAGALRDDEIVRLKDGPKYFGVGRTKISENIRAGLIPTPIHFSERCVGWTGKQIHDWQRQIVEKKAAK